MSQNSQSLCVEAAYRIQAYDLLLTADILTTNTKRLIVEITIRLAEMANKILGIILLLHV